MTVNFHVMHEINSNQHMHESDDEGNQKYLKSIMALHGWKIHKIPLS